MNKKQKLAIIAALVHSPKLMIMDKPFVALDPKATHLLKNTMHELCENGTAIFFSTHLLEVAEKLCDKVAMESWIWWNGFTAIFSHKNRREKMADIIRIEHLNKSFGDVRAVNDLSFRVKQGELFAFLGVNGAGKSTTISILCGQLRKDSGNVWIKGIEADKAGNQTKRMFGVVFQDSVLDRPLTVRENLKSRAALYGITGLAFEKRLQELVEILDFRDFINRPVGKLSGGQRRRIDIARALLHRPEILILDEPTTGLDPQTRLLIWNIIEKLRTEENMTVFLTTHYMEEAAGAGYVVILEKGRIAAEGTPLELKNKYVQDRISLYGVSEEEIKALNHTYKEIRDGYEIMVKNTQEATKLIVEHQELFRDYEVVKGAMDDVFLAVTGNRMGGV